jgi:hypothetical protein
MGNDTNVNVKNTGGHFVKWLYFLSVDEGSPSNFDWTLLSNLDANFGAIFHSIQQYCRKMMLSHFTISF